MKIQINTDGGSRGNPGKAACSFVAQDESGEILMKKGVYLGKATNNVAEYKGLLLAYTWAVKAMIEISIKEINFVLDSELIVKQTKREYRIRNSELGKLADKIWKCEGLLKGKGVVINYTAVRREFNKEADKLVNEVLDNQA